MVARGASLSTPFASKYAALLWLAAAFVFFAVLPMAHLPLFYESFLYLIFFWIALSTSWTILSGFTGYFSFGHGAFYGVGMYAMADLGPHLPLPVVLAIGGALAALLGVGIGAVVFRVRRLRGELFALLTLALAIVLATIVLNTPIDGGPGVFLSGVTPPHIYRSPSSTIYLMGMCVAMASLAMAWVIQRSRFGCGLFAISDDEDVAEILGVPTFAFKLAAIAVSSSIAGVMGAVHAIFVSYVTVGETFSIATPLFVLLMSVLGGARHWFGPAIGAIFVTILSYSFVSGDFALAAHALIGLTLVLTILFLPEGVVGFVQSRLPMSNPAPAKEASAAETIVITPRPDPARLDGRAQPLVEALGIRLAFRGVQALDGVDVTIRQGEILGLVGPNGSGKSTLINVLSGLYKPDSGRVILDGRDFARTPGHFRARLGIARTFQIPRPFTRQSVLDNVMVSAMFGASALAIEAARERAMEALAFVGLADRAEAAPATLNLHQRKFLELARALASGARLIMLDEVLAGLTPREVVNAIAMVRRIHARGATILFVEHNMRAVLELTDRLIVLDRGRLIADGPPRDVMNDPAVAAAYLGAPNAER